MNIYKSKIHIIIWFWDVTQRVLNTTGIKLYQSCLSPQSKFYFWILNLKWHFYNKEYLIQTNYNRSISVKVLFWKSRYYRQTIFNQSNIMVSYVDIFGLCHSVAILWEIYVMRSKCHVMWLRFHLKRMLIKGLGQ